MNLIKHLKVKIEGNRVIVKQNKGMPGVYRVIDLLGNCDTDIRIIGQANTHGVFRLFVCNMRTNEIMETDNKYAIGREKTTIEYKLLVAVPGKYKIGLLAYGSKVNDYMTIDQFTVYDSTNQCELTDNTNQCELTDNTKHVVPRVDKVVHMKPILSNNKKIPFNGKIKTINNFKELGIQQVKISRSISNFKRIKQKYNLSDYVDKTSPCLFFGMYSSFDLSALKKHNGPKYVMWGGTDLDSRLQRTKRMIKGLGSVDNICYISISDDLSIRMNMYLMKYYQIDFTLLNDIIFRPIDIKDRGSKIYIYNGYSPNHESRYGKNIYIQVMKRLPEFEYVTSNCLKVSYESMPGIYKQCFIGLRLTEYDGNANTVQEFQAMELPIIHNQSVYGIRWKTVDDVVNIINNEYQKINNI
jgi:hypothetical protein